MQTINYHKKEVLKIIELKNQNLVSCSYDQSIIFFMKDKSSYKKDFKISLNGPCGSLIQSKDTEVCYCQYIKNYQICFYDFNQRKLKSSLSNINCNGYTFRTFNMITKDLLAVGGVNKISIININLYSLVREIEIPNSNIFGFCRINDNIFLTGDNNGAIIQWKIEGNNMIEISKKEKAHFDSIYTLIKMGNGLIASGSCDKSIKIWWNINKKKKI